MKEPEILISLDMEDTFKLLKHRSRILLWLAYAEGYSCNEIAEMTEIKKNSVKVQLFRARKELAQSSILCQKQSLNFSPFFSFLWLSSSFQCSSVSLLLPLKNGKNQYKRVLTQLLFSYKINPRTVLFIGYSDNYLGSQDFGLTQLGRTFFVKLGYAWVL